MSDSKFTVDEAVYALTRRGYPVNSQKRLITVHVVNRNTNYGQNLKILKRPIGNRLWAKIDFLIKYKEYRTVFTD